MYYFGINLDSVVKQLDGLFANHQIPSDYNSF